MLGEKLLQKRIAYAEAWNFAPYSFESFTVKEVAGVAKSIWDSINIEFSQPQENFHEAGLLKLDSAKSISLLGWKPQWNTENAIRKTIEWYKGYYLDSKALTIDQIKSYLGDNGIH